MVKENEQGEVRFSWWKDRKMMMRPLDLSEKDLLILMQDAIEKEVFTSEFRSKLKLLL